MSHIAIVLARGGSKRLPRKNILDFHGKPMVAWTVESALISRKFDRVLLSTDDQEIADIGRSYGADVPFLRMTAKDDISSSSEATLAALSQAEEHWGQEFDVVTQLMANCPLRDAVDIECATTCFETGVAPSQISCFRYGWMNPWWAARLDESGEPKYVFPEAHYARSQDLQPLYCPSGAIWTAHVSALKTAGSFYMPKHRFFPLHWVSAMDIDDAEDLEMASACFLVKNGKGVHA
jgi:CMP-N-acetylneuraminic acid synthetase